MRRLCKACVMFAMMAAVMAPAVAAAQQSMNFSIGGFNPRGEDARAKDDVLVNNLSPLAFRIADFDGVTVGAEYLVGLGDKFEAGLGGGFYQRAVPTVYNNFVNLNGTEIEQELKLRVIPLTATVRFLPLGHSGVEPYIGAGVGVFAFRYSESGQFLATDSSIFRDTFVGSGTATGPVVLGGIRVPVGSWGVGGELRYQSAQGALPGDQGFAGSKIDLGGITYSFMIHVRF
jgi:outer membrane protein W